mgnify:CR=1 FL=1
MKCGPEQVETVQILDDAIADFLGIRFGFKGAEHLVPDDEYPGIIAVTASNQRGIRSIASVWIQY